MWDFLDKNVVPIFKSLIGWLGNESGLMPMLEKVSTFLQGAFLKALEVVGAAIKNMSDWLAGLLDKIREWRRTDIPDDFEPGSPPPLYYALRDINEEMATMAGLRLPQLANAWANAPTARAAAGTAGAASLGDRMAGAMSNVDRSAHIQVNANYANQQSESDVARDVRTVLDLMGWR